MLFPIDAIGEECDAIALKFVDSLGENYIVYRCTRVMILTGLLLAFGKVLTVPMGHP